MINLTGTQTQYREIYPQTGDFSANLSLRLSNPSGGSLEFGFSGVTGNPWSMRFGSGMVFDNENRFVGSYGSKRPALAEVKFSGGNYNIYSAGKPVAAGSPLGAHSYSNLFFKTTGPTGTADIYLSGQRPSISVTGTGIMDDNGLVTGVINKIGYASRDLKVFSVSLSGGNGFITESFDTTISDAGNLVLSGDPNSTGVFFQRFSIDSNAGVFRTGMYAKRTIVSSGGYLNIFPYNDDQIVNNNVGSGANHSATGTYVMTMDNSASTYPYFDFKLRQISGSGALYTQYQGYITGGSGNASGTLTGSGFLWSNDGSGKIYYNSGGYTGSCVATDTVGKVFKYATGQIVYPYVILMSGSGSSDGINKPLYNTTGLYTGTATGTIVGNSGSFTFNRQIISDPGPPNVYSVSGSPVGALSPWTSGTFTGQLNATTPATGFYSAHYTGNLSMTGICPVYVGDKTFTGTWDLQTGKYLNSGYISFRDSGWSGNNPARYDNDGHITETVMPGGFQRLYARVIYTNPYPQIRIDHMILSGSNGLQSGGFNISGRYNV